MTIQILSLEEAFEDNGLKILVHGMAGSGKTVMSATAGMPTILLSAESGLLSLKKFMKESKALTKNVKVIKISSFSDLREAREWLEDQPQMADWLILDSVSEIAEQILAYEKSISKDPRAAYGNLTDQMLAELRKFRDLPGYNVMMTCKQVREVDEDTKRTRYVPSFPGRQVGAAVPYMFDEVFALRVEEDDEGQKYRTVQTDRDVHYEAKDRSGELDMFEDPNLKHILYKINPDYVMVRDRDPETLKSANELRKLEEEEQEQEELDDEQDGVELEDGGSEENEEQDEQEQEEQEQEEENTDSKVDEFVVAPKPMFFYHPESESFLSFKKGDQVSVEVIEQCTEMKRKEWDEAKKAAEEKAHNNSAWRCCDCDAAMGNEEPESGSECGECGGTEFYEDA